MFFIGLFSQGFALTETGTTYNVGNNIEQITYYNSNWFFTDGAYDIYKYDSNFNFIKNQDVADSNDDEIEGITNEGSTIFRADRYDTDVDSLDTDLNNRADVASIKSSGDLLSTSDKYYSCCVDGITQYDKSWNKEQTFDISQDFEFPSSVDIKSITEKEGGGFYILIEFESGNLPDSVYEYDSNFNKVEEEINDVQPTDVGYSSIAHKTGDTYFVAGGTTFTELQENQAPNSPSNPSPSDSSSGLSTSPSLKVDVSDPDGDSMDVTFYDASDDSVIGTDSSVSDGGTASVTWTGLSNGQSYSWYAIAYDGDLNTTSSTWSFTTNYLPSISLSSPSDGATGISTSPTLEASVSDQDGDSMDVTFYDASDDSVIGTDSNVADGNTASLTWSNLNHNTQYSWYVTADDGTDSTTSGTDSFTTTYISTESNSAALTGSTWIEGSGLSWVTGGTEYVVNNPTTVDASSPGLVGSAWIEGTKIHWISESGSELSIEGNVFDASTAAPNGYTWIENSYIHYVDTNGDERVLNGN